MLGKSRSSRLRVSSGGVGATGRERSVCAVVGGSSIRPAEPPPPCCAVYSWCHWYVCMCVCVCVALQPERAEPEKERESSSVMCLMDILNGISRMLLDNIWNVAKPLCSFFLQQNVALQVIILHI